MADREQIIRVVYEATAAEQAARARSQAEQRRTREDAEVAKTAAKDVAKTSGDVDKDMRRMKAEAAKEAAQRVKDLNRSLDDEDKRRADRSKALDKEIAQMKAQAAKEAADKVKAFNRELDLDDKRKEEALKKQQQEWQRTNDTVVGAAKAVGMFVVAQLGLNSAAAAMAAIYERFEKIREASIEGANRMIAQAAGMRSLSSVMGQTGQPSLTQVEMLRLGAQTMQTPEEAATMHQAAMGKGFGAVQAGLVSREELDKALVFQGRRQVLYGESPEAMGMISGMLPMLSEKKGQTGEQLEALNQRLDEIRKLAGYKSYAQAVGQIEKVSPYVLKGIETGPMAMALTGAAALAGSPEEAGMHHEQAMQAVTVGMMRSRHMKVLPEMAQQFVTTAEYFKGLKSKEGKPVTDQMEAHERLLAVVDDVIRAEDEARKAGKHFEGTLYLTQKGFLNQEHMLAITGLAGVERKGLLRPLIAAAQAPLVAPGPGVGVGADWEQAKRDPVFANIIAEREADLAEQATFAKDRFRNVQARAAYARLGGKGKFGEALEPILGRTDFNLYEAIWEPRRDIEMEAQRQILDQAGKAGVKLPFDTGGGATGHPHFVGWERLFDIAQQTGAAGGRILPGPNDDANAANLKRIADNTDRLLGLGGPAPAVARAPNVVIQPEPAGRMGN